MNDSYVIDDDEEVVFDLPLSTLQDELIKERLILDEDEIDEALLSNLTDNLSTVDINILDVGGNKSIEMSNLDISNSTDLSSLTYKDMSSYVLPNESKLVSDRYNKIQRLLQSVNNEPSSGEMVYRKLYKFLESSSCSAIPNKTYIFLSNKYKTKGNFPVHIVNAFINLQQSCDENNVSLNYESVWEEILDIIKEENIIFSEDRLKEMKLAIKNFSTFFEVTYATFKSKVPDAIQILEYIDINAPSLVIGDGYVCQCGSIVETPYPPLSVLITKSQGGYSYNLVNNPVVCGCHRVLALPELIVNVLEPLLVKEIELLEVSIKGYAIYRLPIETIVRLIPTNLKYLFDLRNFNGNIIDMVGDNNNVIEYYHNYISLVRYLMSNKNNIINRKELESIEKDLADIPYINNISKVFNSLSIDLNIELNLNNFVRTLTHYLDTLGCFALTPQSLAQYQYYKMTGINRECFSQEYALEWLYENAWALAGLKFITAGNTLYDIEILPEYVPVINYIYMIRILSMSDNLNSSSSFKSWLSNPSSDTSRRFIKSVTNKSNKGELTNIITSSRNLFDIPLTVSAKSFRNLYYLLSDVSDNIYVYDRVMKFHPELEDLISRICIEDEKSFFNLKENNEGYLIEQTLMFNEFQQVFNGIGKYLFFSSISSIRTIETAKLIVLANHNGTISTYFNSSEHIKNNLKYLLVKRFYDSDYINRLIEDVLFLSDNNLPEDVIQTRDTLSKQSYLDFIRSNKLEILENCSLRGIYPEVFR